MRMPGFTAEASVYRGNVHYHSTSTGSDARDSGGTVPAYFRRGHWPGLPTPQISVSWQPPSTICGDNGTGTLTIEGQFWPAGQSAGDFCVNISNCGEAGDNYPPINCFGPGTNPPQISQSAQAESVFWIEPPRLFSYTNFKITGASCFCGGSSTVTVTDSFGNMVTETVNIPCTPC